MTSFVKSAVMMILALQLAACYHMRVVAEPIKSRTITTRQTPAETLLRVKKILEDQLHLRVVDEAQGGLALIFAPRQFYLDTSFGQPAGGRKYFVQLLIEVEGQKNSTIKVTGRNFELRTSYVYSDHGQLETLYKVYPYEQYPGMFNTDIMNKEVKNISEIIGQQFKE